MALVTLFSTRGAPGVTTTALGLSLVWPRPSILIEADVSGSSSIGGGYLQGAIPPGQGLINLAVEHRSGTLSAASIRNQAQALTKDSARRAILALNSATQIAALTPTFWERLAYVLRELTANTEDALDVIVDAGRIGAVGWPKQVAQRSDSVLVVTRTHLDALVSVHANTERLRAFMDEAPIGTDGLGLVLIGEGRPYRAKETASTVGLPVVTTVAFDPANADALSRGKVRQRRFGTSVLVRSLRSAADDIARAAAYNSEQLARPDGARAATGGQS
jgi:hypothetical protein